MDNFGGNFVQIGMRGQEGPNIFENNDRVLVLDGKATFYEPTGQFTRSGEPYINRNQVLPAVSLQYVGTAGEGRPFKYGVIADVAYRPPDSNVTIHIRVPVLDRLPEKSIKGQDDRYRPFTWCISDVPWTSSIDQGKSQQHSCAGYHSGRCTSQS